MNCTYGAGTESWAGSVVAWNNINGAHGRRVDGESAANQWKADDMIYGSVLVKGMKVIVLARQTPKETHTHRHTEARKRNATHIRTRSSGFAHTTPT